MSLLLIYERRSENGRICYARPGTPQKACFNPVGLGQRKRGRGVLLSDCGSRGLPRRENSDRRRTLRRLRRDAKRQAGQDAALLRTHRHGTGGRRLGHGPAHRGSQNRRRRGAALRPRRERHEIRNSADACARRVHGRQGARRFLRRALDGLPPRRRGLFRRRAHAHKARRQGRCLRHDGAGLRTDIRRRPGQDARQGRREGQGLPRREARGRHQRGRRACEAHRRARPKFRCTTTARWGRSSTSRSR